MKLLIVAFYDYHVRHVAQHRKIHNCFVLWVLQKLDYINGLFCCWWNTLLLLLDTILWFITSVLFCVFLFLCYSCTSSSGWQCKRNPGIWTSCKIGCVSVSPFIVWLRLYITNNHLRSDDLMADRIVHIIIITIIKTDII